ncbi:ABC transporter ATP-binding protein [Jatrophihabitans sp. YIM 134969]
MTLRTVRLTLGYDDRTVVEDLDLDLHPGTTAVVGPNGCGKSTLLRALGRLLPPRAGHAELDGRAVGDWNTKALARRLALLPQTTQAPPGLTVRDLVARGRFAHQGLLRQPTRADVAIVDETLAAVGLTAEAGRHLDQLSGGQRQRAWIGMTLAQRTDVLLLDEPTTYLDLAHQVEVLDLVHRLTVDGGLTTVVVLHDLGLAARYADRLVVLHGGRVHADGHPREVLTEAMLRDVFGLSARVLTDPDTGDPVVVPHTAVRRPAAATPTKELTA